MPETPNGLPIPDLNGPVKAGAAAIVALAGAVDDRLLRGGSSFVAAEESLSSGSMGVLATPDRVSGLVLPANALVDVWFLAEIKESHANQASIGVALQGGGTFVYGANNMQANGGPAAGSYGIVRTGGWPTVFGFLDVSTYHSMTPLTAVTLWVQNAGTYDIEILYGTSTGTVTARNRRLWVRLRH